LLHLGSPVVPRLRPGRGGPSGGGPLPPSAGLGGGAGSAPGSDTPLPLFPIFSFDGPSLDGGLQSESASMLGSRPASSLLPPYVEDPSLFDLWDYHISVCGWNVNGVRMDLMWAEELYGRLSQRPLDVLFLVDTRTSPAQKDYVHNALKFGLAKEYMVYVFPGRGRRVGDPVVGTLFLENRSESPLFRPEAVEVTLWAVLDCPSGPCPHLGGVLHPPSSATGQADQGAHGASSAGRHRQAPP
jgi:hypothetical protein